VPVAVVMFALPGYGLTATCQPFALPTLALVGVVNALRPLRMSGTLRSAMHIANDYKVMASMRSYPYDATRGATPLMPDAMKTFRKELSCGAWNGSGALYGTRRQVKEARRLVKRALQGKVNKIQFLDDFMLRIASRFAIFH